MRSEGGTATKTVVEVEAEAGGPWKWWLRE
jgi:hypothetical protein